MKPFFFKLIYYWSLCNKNEKWYRFAQRKRLHSTEFSIFSNNCWGGGVMEDLGLPYSSPTVGLYFFAPCYITFLKNLQNYLSTPLTFLSESKYSFANEQRAQKWYPIGQIGASELHFVHYDTEKEALEKWNRRKERFSKEHLYVAFSDRDQCTPDLIKEFDRLPFKNKVFFSSKNIPGIHSLIWLKEYRNDEYIGDIYSNRWNYRKYFDVIQWLNQS